ncbi:MAG: hypothetical protein HZA50_18475 [Planctomycetes bacterium]|nr:hypothetical protein [Planctomycetota bacterium]
METSMDETSTDNKPRERAYLEIIAACLLIFALIVSIFPLLFAYLDSNRGIEGLCALLFLWPFCTWSGAILSLLVSLISDSMAINVPAYILTGIDLVLLAIFIVLAVWH